MEYNQILIELERQRKLVFKRIKITILMFLGLILLGFLLGYITSTNGYVLQFYTLAAFISFFVSIGFTLDSAGKFRKKFKENLMPLLIEKVGMDITYDYKGGLSELQTEEARLFKRPDRFSSEDLMYGTFEGVKFYSSDVILRERRVIKDREGRRKTVYEPYFSGRWFVYDFNKTFNGIIQVREDSFFSGPVWGLNIKKVSLEDVEFNKKFKTYSTNEYDAFYVLTPSLMQNIKELERMYPGRIYLSFIGTQLHIAIATKKNTFEAKVFRAVDNQFIEEQIQDIKITQEIVKELRLNRKIFK